jgi:hypothetical protein
MALRYVPLVLLCLLAACGSEPRTAVGPRLYLAGDGELWVVDAGTEHVRHAFSAQLGPGDPPHKVLARGHRIIMGSPYGDGAFFLPSARPDRVWVVDLDPAERRFAPSARSRSTARRPWPPPELPVAGGRWAR